MSESGGGGFTQPTSPTSGLAPYGGDAPQRKTPKAERVKSQLKRLARQHRAAQTVMRKNTEGNTMAKTYEELMDELNTAVLSAIEAAPEEREDILNKAYKDLETGLTESVQLVIEDQVAESNPMVNFTETLAKSAGDDEELAKGLTDVADFAFALHKVEDMMERMAAIIEGKRNFPSTIGMDMSEEDLQVQKEHAGACLDIIVPFYSMGLVALQRLTGAVVEGEDGDVHDAEHAEEILKSDMAHFYAGVSEYDITPEQAYEVLNKAFGPDPEEAPGPTDPGDDNSPEDPEDGMDDTDVDPLETVKRLAAAILLQIDAIAQADGGDDADPEDQAPGQSGQGQPMAGNPSAAQQSPGGPGSIQKADINTMMKAAIDNELAKALEPLVGENAALRAETIALREEVEKLGKMAAPIGDKGALNPEDRSGGGLNLDSLAKMDPEAARHELFKAALSNPSR